MAQVAQLNTRVAEESLTKRSELLDLIKARSFRQGRFVLSSGKESALYFNMKPTMMSPRGAELAAGAFLEIIQELGIEYIGGLEMGAVPVIGSVAAMSSTQLRPAHTFFVRKKAKSHGTMDLIEGLGPDESLAGKRVLVIDDVATSGKSILQAIEAVRSVGGIVEHASALVDREEGASALLQSEGVELHPIFSAHEFVAAS